MTALADKLKAALIRSEIARRGAVDAETVEMIIDSLSIVSDAGEIISRDTGKPLAAMLDDLQKTNGAWFETPKPAAPRAIIDPTKPGFNLTAAIAAARSDPQIYDEIMARLAPRPMTPGAR